MATEDDDKKVKDLIDAGTQADLERWFGLPSYAALPDNVQVAPAPDPYAGLDPEMIAVREQRAKAVAAVEPWMLEGHAYRTSGAARLMKLVFEVDLHIEKSISKLDETMGARSIAEPREVELPEDIVDAMAECAPQALLRDLHRPVTDFDFILERPDPPTEEELEAKQGVREIMAKSVRVQLDKVQPLVHARNLHAGLMTDFYKDWSHALPKFPNRYVTE